MRQTRLSRRGKGGTVDVVWDREGKGTMKKERKRRKEER